MSTTTFPDPSVTFSRAAPDARVLDEPDQTERFTRGITPENESGERRIGVSSLRLSGITCAACALPIEQALPRQDGAHGAFGRHTRPRTGRKVAQDGKAPKQQRGVG